MNAFTWVFVGVVALNLVGMLWLHRRQLSFVRDGRGQVPPAFAGAITPDSHARAADHTIAMTRFSAAAAVFDLVLVVVWTLGGGIEAVDSAWGKLDFPGFVLALCVIGTVAVIAYLLTIPLSAYATFRIEGRFGFNRTSPGLFIADRAKSLAVTLVFTLVLAAPLLLLMEHAGSWWWLAAWAAFIAVQVLFALLLPVFVLPLFMKLTPVEDGDLRGRVESLLARCGVSANGVFVSDASRRTSHGNAFFAGIGATRRIVLFDTLLKDMQPGEVDGVVAHEIGHLKLRHVPKSLVAVAALAAIAFALLGWLADERWFYEGLGVDTPSRQAALLLFAIAGPLFAAVLQPLQMAMSRRFELEADDFAARYAAAEDLASGLVRMTDLSAVAIDSDPAYSAVYENHPPVGRRVARLLDGQGDGRRLTPAAGVAGGGP